MRIKYFVFFNLVLSSSLFLSHFSLAVPPPDWLPKSKQPTCHTNTKAQMERINFQKRFAPNLAPPISATTYKLAVIRVDFPDKSMSRTKAWTESAFSSFRDFYLENSFNLLSVDVTVTGGGTGSEGAFRLLKNHSYYAKGIDSKYEELVLDAIATATANGFNFSSYDHVMLYHAGEGSETSSLPNSLIWSVYFSSIGDGPKASGKTFPGITVVPEKEVGSVDPLGVVCHEYGHQLGLPDLYNTSTGGNSVGKWSLMDGGSYLGTPQGAKPAHLDAWSKLFLGFSNPQTISYTEETSKTISQAQTSRAGFVRLPIEVSATGGSNEYFLLEYRRTGGATYDTGLPAQGLLIWHIDDSIASDSAKLSNNTVNVDPSHKGVDLVEADSSDPSTNNGDSGDPWSDTSSDTVFKSPKANAYNATDSGIQVSNITTPGFSSISFKIKMPFSNPTVAQNSVSVRGGEKGYTNPELGEKALISFKPSKSEPIEIKVFSLNGDIVWETKVDGIQDQKKDLNWDGKNSDGTTVSSGIYLLHVSGGGINSKKKVAIAR
ncbi:MAG: M6 family metalloprotease domain-containing protein [Elusimicrobia bacterium]|nr:M6 family metalloprotease domain-containing protein [Elusimicrobiota bacterium]